MNHLHRGLKLRCFLTMDIGLNTVYPASACAHPGNTLMYSSIACASCRCQDCRPDRDQTRCAEGASLVGGSGITAAVPGLLELVDLDEADVSPPHGVDTPIGAH